MKDSKEYSPDNEALIARQGTSLGGAIRRSSVGCILIKTSTCVDQLLQTGRLGKLQIQTVYTTGRGGWHLDTQSDVPDAIRPWPCKEHPSDATCILLNPDGRAKPSIGWQD
ncbi:hypothetical protein PGT21_030074 [Puccinia graminis f. sp. tritici]|uniref:Uncharacterized protein n=1 Tax=Puccinia graminis f. sp. tritici TaxID=56615 RepID=A0A5B0NH12_PUCGR|nr:hypothetical protein PGT21_030074 [Puccinia graminis f. sp. tritici]